MGNVLAFLVATVVNALAVAFFVLVAKRDLAYVLVIVRALAWIAASHGGHLEVASLAQVGAAGIAMAIHLLGLIGAIRRPK
jgi:hypothetical protein